MLSENLKKISDFISYDERNEFNKLVENLDKLTVQYHGITNYKDVNICLTNRVFFKPPPQTKKID